jgi:hypothetical protein
MHRFFKLPTADIINLTISLFFLEQRITFIVLYERVYFIHIFKSSMYILKLLQLASFYGTGW